MKREENLKAKGPINAVSLTLLKSNLQRYKSRIQHAKRRPRDQHGRFYKKGEAPGEQSVESAKEETEALKNSQEITKASNE